MRSNGEVFGGLVGRFLSGELTPAAADVWFTLLIAQIVEDVQVFSDNAEVSVTSVVRASRVDVDHIDDTRGYGEKADGCLLAPQVPVGHEQLRAR